MSIDAETAWRDLSVAWKAAFDEAWTSWCNGDYGIGAALVDPTTEAIVTTGRNRINDATTPTDSEPRHIGGNFVAHAEMNALIALDRFKADELHLYTTLEPCLMCAASCVLMHVQAVHFAASDEMFAGIDELWDQHPYGRKRKPSLHGPLNTPLAGFARVLPLVRSVESAPRKWVMQLAHQEEPALAALAEELVGEQKLDSLRGQGASTAEVLTELWPRLPKT